MTKAGLSMPRDRPELEEDTESRSGLEEGLSP